jgi:fatty acid synthase
MGKLKNIDRFDASFFGLPETVANDTDPQSRLLLETTAEAIFDAGKSNFQNIISREIHDTISGVDLSKLRGTNTGVYIGFTTIGTAEGIPQTDEEAVNNAFLMMGTSRAIYANRINFVFDFRGPSNIMDTACASSMSAIYHAMNDIKSGACDQAVVGGVNLCLAPFSNYLMTAVGAVSATGQSRVFDDKANGYVRSEACVTVFLQRKSSAKRVYATILNCRTNTDGFKKPGLFFPSSEMQSKLMARVCSEAGIDPLSIKYFEAHGTGTRVGDPQEVIAINNTYCNEERTSPLLIGSVKSVVGHSEGASGLVSIAKVLISFEKQMIPANLNFDSSNDLIKDLIPKKIRVVTQNTLFPGGIVGLNSYGIGGVNVNLLLKSNENINNSKKCENQKDKIPRLICLCARNPEMINNLFEFVEKNPGKIDEYFLSLMNNIIHYKPTIGSSGFPCRGYMMARNYSNESTNSCSELEFVKKIKLYSETKPLVFLFPGFGCQWPTMGKSLMPIETFSNTIDELANILTEFNIDLKQILISDDVMALKSCTSIFVAITAIQIALVNVMKMIDIRPDFIIGHSFGEIACAYADGALTSREAILCSFWRGNCLENSSIIPGAMIAVQMSWAEAMKKCEGTRIIAACHNSENSVTLSGPELEILQMKRDFEEENKFVRQIRGVEFPFHTPYLKSVGISMINKLDNIIKQPKNRTVRWLSTSLSEEQLFNSDLNFASSKYFVNNLLSPVYFYEAILKLPENCVIMEIGPHSLFESILKNKSGNSYVSLMKRDDNDNNLIRLLSSVGELYLNGFSPKIENLYPKIEPPVPRGTQSISSLIKWDHGKCYFVRKFPDYYNHVSSSNYTYSIKLGPSSRYLYELSLNILFLSLKWYRFT